MHQATQLPGLFVYSDEDEYPPTEEAMQLMYANAASPAKKLVHYSAAEQAPWLWYETPDASKVPAHGGKRPQRTKGHRAVSFWIAGYLVSANSLGVVKRPRPPFA